MGVSRLDTCTFDAIVGNGNPTKQYLAPINGYLTMGVTGSLGGGTITLQITHDGINWLDHSGVSLTTANTAATLNVIALGARPKMTGATSPNAVVTIAMIEY